MTGKNRERLQDLLGRENVPMRDIVNLVEDIVRDERDDAGRRGFNLGWDSALDTDENRADRPQVT